MAIQGFIWGANGIQLANGIIGKKDYMSLLPKTFLSYE
jgi:hypothetical protein